MLEVELKYAVADHHAVSARLLQLGAAPDATRQDVDRYFNAPDRDFARTDEALRIRSNGKANFVTYKGPKLDAQSKTRTEIEVPLAAGADVAERFGLLLEHLGYRPVHVVRKERRTFELSWEDFHVELCLDEVAGVGRFVELECQSEEAHWEGVRDALLRLAAQLDLKSVERRSYLELSLIAQEKNR